MGRARDLTETKPRRKSKSSAADLAALRYMTQAARPDPDTFRAILDRVGVPGLSTGDTEGIVYLNACRRYRVLSGEDYGPAGL